MYHSRKSFKKYRKNTKKNNDSGRCPFCDPNVQAEYEAETKLFFIKRNAIEYDFWENHPVEEHLMVIPKRHVENFLDMTPEERLEMMEVAAEYESKGYNIYARGVGSPRRTVAHQHTHLIKIGGELPRLLVRVEKPYMLVRF